MESRTLRPPQQLAVPIMRPKDLRVKPDEQAGRIHRRITAESQSTSQSDYDDVQAFLIYYKEHDHDAANFKQEIEEVYDLFVNSLGCSKCWRVEIPGYPMDAGSYVRDYLAYVQENSDGENVLQLVYYGGHGGRGRQADGLRALSKVSGGQSLDWSSLQRNSIFSLGNDTVVFLDCCNAGLAFRGEPKGRKDVFAACSEAEVTAGPGIKSFTSLLLRAFASVKDEYFDDDDGFTMADWVWAATSLADATNCVKPVYRSFGETQLQIRFRPQAWIAKNKLRQELKEYTLRKQQLLEICDVLQADIAELPQSDSHVLLLPSEDELSMMMIIHDEPVEQLDKIKIYQTLMKCRSFIVGHKLGLRYSSHAIRDR